MSEAIRETFRAKAALDLPVFVTFVTAGYPKPELTVDIMLAMEAGGADIIELGVPFTDPVADGPAIQESNNIALNAGVTYASCLEFIKEARGKGLKAPVILMGYYNPTMAYGEQRAVQDAKKAGANGYIMVDLPPEEAIKFREICTSEGLSYVPLIAPSTSANRIKLLGGIADSFLYVVSKYPGKQMGTTGASTAIATDLPELLKRINSLLPRPTPLAVGFGVSTREHFDNIGAQTDGVVIGSKIVAVIKAAAPGQEAQAVREYCTEVSGGANRTRTRIGPFEGQVKSEEVNLQNVGNSEANNVNHATPVVDEVITESKPLTELNDVSKANSLPARFGQFGGAYVPEALFDCLIELEEAHAKAKNDPEFWKEFRSYYGYMNRPSNLYFAERMTEAMGGAKIWFKREDLNHTGSHKINNAVGQILLARKIGKTRIIAETGAGQHGVATATVCAKFGMECIVYMGAEDVRRQALNVFRMKMLGAKVVAVASGSQTLKDAINEAMRDWVTNLSTTHYLIGSAIGPHPFPTIVRDFQSCIGNEIKEQMQAEIGKLPDAVVACVGGGSNAIGTFYPFIEDKSVRMIGVEAGGEGIDTAKHSATLAKGTLGVLHGVKTYLLQTISGQITETHSISAGLDYPGVGPEHAHLKDSLRAEYVAATDEEALRGFRMACEYEGIIPALETSHAIWSAAQLAKTMPKDSNIVLTCSGRGDKDVAELLEILPKWQDKLDWHIAH